MLPDRDLSRIDVHAIARAPSLPSLSPASVIDEDLAHGVCRDRKEVIAILPIHLCLVNQFQVGLVDEGAGIEGNARPPPPELAAGDTAQLGGEQFNEPVEGACLAFAMGDEESRDAFGS